MEIKRDSLLQVVKATRTALRLAEGMRSVLADPRNETCADRIAWHLTEALFLMSDETLTAGQDFGKDSSTMRILMSDMDDGACADWFIMMDKIRKKVSEPESNSSEITVKAVPIPHIMSKEEAEMFYRMNGGYQYKPDENKK